jgi:hypothetical protein
MDRCNAESMQQSLQQQLEQQRRAYEMLKADSSQRDREQQDQIQDLHLRVVNEQEEKVGSGLPACLPPAQHLPVPCLVWSARRRTACG